MSSDFSCTNCKKVFNGQTYSNHVRLSACSESLKLLFNVNLKRQTLKCVTVKNKERTSSKYTCSVCNKAFRNNWFLQRHEKSGHKKSFKCNCCSKTFESKSFYKRHLKFCSPVPGYGANGVESNLLVSWDQFYEDDIFDFEPTMADLPLYYIYNTKPAVDNVDDENQPPEEILRETTKFNETPGTSTGVSTVVSSLNSVEASTVTSSLSLFKAVDGDCPPTQPTNQRITMTPTNENQRTLAQSAKKRCFIESNNDRTLTQMASEHVLTQATNEHTPPKFNSECTPTQSISKHAVSQSTSECTITHTSTRGRSFTQSTNDHILPQATNERAFTTSTNERPFTTATNERGFSQPPTEGILTQSTKERSLTQSTNGQTPTQRSTNERTPTQQSTNERTLTQSTNARIRIQSSNGRTLIRSTNERIQTSGDSYVQAYTHSIDEKLRYFDNSDYYSPLLLRQAS